MTRLIKSICLAGLLLFSTISCTRADQEVDPTIPSTTELYTTEWCAPRTELLAFLSEAAWERPVAMARTDEGDLLEVLASNLGGSWSILVTDSEGIACIERIGHNWKTLVILNYGREAGGRI